GLAYSSGTEIWHEISIQPWMPHVVANLTTSTYFLPMLFGLGAVNLAKNPDGLLAMGWAGLMGQNQLERRWAKARQARIAEAESTLHQGEEVAPPVGLTEEKVLEVVGDGATASEGQSAQAPVLLMEDIVAGYGDVEVLHGVSVAVEPGQIVALLGANGA